VTPTLVTPLRAAISPMLSRSKVKGQVKYANFYSASTPETTKVHARVKLHQNWTSSFQVITFYEQFFCPQNTETAVEMKVEMSPEFIITSRLHRKTYSYQVTSVSDTQFLQISYGQTHIATE